MQRMSFAEENNLPPNLLVSMQLQWICKLKSPLAAWDEGAWRVTYQGREFGRREPAVFSARRG